MSFFIEIVKKALQTGAEKDIEQLAMWCEANLSYNGEFYDVSLPDEPTGTRRLYPIYKEVEPDEFELTGWRLA